MYEYDPWNAVNGDGGGMYYILVYAYWPSSLVVSSLNDLTVRLNAYPYY